MIQLLIENPLLLFFTVAALGYILGEIKIGGSSLGVAATLFAGLAIGALHPELRLPEIITQLGLVLFVYTIGLSSGPGFFASFQRKGVRDNLFIFGMLTLAFMLTVSVSVLFDLGPALTSGLFAGSLTNTPTLAGVLEYIQSNVSAGTAPDILNEPVVGYSIAYPVGVIGMILAVSLAQRFFRIDYARESQQLKDYGVAGKKLEPRTIRVTRGDAGRETVAEMVRKNGWDVIFGRFKHGDEGLSMTTGSTRFQPGDLVVAVGSREDLDRVVETLGEPAGELLELDRSQYDFRRIFISNPEVAGHRLQDLNLLERFGAIVTRIRRGDVEWLPKGNTVLELGDRVRVVAKPEIMPAVSKFFGDSYRSLSEINLFSFSLGVLLGLLVGLIPIPLPGGLEFKLGLSGGPLVVGLILGKVGRTGPIVWHLSYSGNLLLRQVGLALFFAAVGTSAGHAFFTTLTRAGGLTIFVAGAIITCLTALATVWVGYRVFKIPMSLLSGMLAGLQTQPAVLGYSLQQSKNELPNIGYATVFPIATITKILYAQLLFILLSRL